MTVLLRLKQLPHLGYQILTKESKNNMVNPSKSASPTQVQLELIKQFEIGLALISVPTPQFPFSVGAGSVGLMC
jgi:hypothetical protein